MTAFTLDQAEEEIINSLVQQYVGHQELLEIFLNNVDGLINKTKSLMPLVHSVKKRLKTPSSLRDKLIRQLDRDKKEGIPFHINGDNFFTEINDLAAYRILHLHTTQMEKIHKILLGLFEANQHELVETPKANIWDDESRSYFEGIGIETKVNPRMYASVHYIISSTTKTKLTCEIQVRTLSDELWGEVDHRINYPKPTDSIACSEQIRVLARVASSASRLVDSIFRSYDDHVQKKDQAGSD